MKRFFSYIFVYLLITFFFAAILACVVFVFDEVDTSSKLIPCQAYVESATSGKVVSDRMRGLAEKYRTATVQRLTVTYEYEGQFYREEQEVRYDIVIYNSEPNISGMVAKQKFNAESSIMIYLHADNFHMFEVEDNGRSENDTLMLFLKIAAPIYAIMMIAQTVNVVKKEKEIKKQKFYASFHK